MVRDTKAIVAPSGASTQSTLTPGLAQPATTAVPCLNCVCQRNSCTVLPDATLGLSSYCSCYERAAALLCRYMCSIDTLQGQALMDMYRDNQFDKTYRKLLHKLHIQHPSQIQVCPISVWVEMAESASGSAGRASTPVAQPCCQVAAALLLLLCASTLLKLTMQAPF